jgi:hypothetical protein
MSSPLAGEGLGGGRSNAVVRNPNANRSRFTEKPFAAGEISTVKFILAELLTNLRPHMRTS